MEKALIAGNWKMNGIAGSAQKLVAALRQAVDYRADLLVCPPSTLVASVAHMLQGSGIAVGGQDCHTRSSGAHTGDISAAMLRDAGATHVILGHSERRTDHHETDALVRAKTEAAIAAGLTPIVCVGETLEQREAGQARAVVAAQLAGSLPEIFGQAGGVIAYEPVWAIGTGRTPTDGDIAAIHAEIRITLVGRFGPVGDVTRILYGGSVKPSNATPILALPHVGGALVGGASLVAEDFLAIAAAAP